MRRKLTVLVAGLAAAMGMLAVPGSASATVTCTTDDFGRPALEIVGQSETAALRVIAGGAIGYDPDGSGDSFAPCGNATVSSTDTIFVGGEAGTGQGLMIDLGGGQFAPGFSTIGDPSGGPPEIEWSVNLRGGSRYIPDFIWVKGSEGPDGITGHGSGTSAMFGVTHGIDLNNSGTESAFNDVDVFFPELIPDVVKLLGQGGDDFISHAALRGLPYLNPAYLLQVEGGAGLDYVQGTARRNTHAKCRRQTLFVRLTFDRLSRDKHYECVMGGDERDRMYGLEGDDKLLGEGGPDIIFAGPGDDRVDGGPGDDNCSPGTGRDTFRNCE